MGIDNVRIDAFTDELTLGLRERFKILKTNLNGSGRPTAEQITQCVLESGVDVQKYSFDYIEEYEFMELTEPLRDHPKLGESMRPMYDAVSMNGNGKKN